MHRPTLLIYLGAAAVLAAGYFLDESTCVWRALTGWACPGCGTIHAMLAMAQGQFAAAWNFNPVSFLVVPILSWHGMQKLKERFA